MPSESHIKTKSPEKLKKKKKRRSKIITRIERSRIVRASDFSNAS